MLEHKEMLKETNKTKQKKKKKRKKDKAYKKDIGVNLNKTPIAKSKTI